MTNLNEELISAYELAFRIILSSKDPEVMQTAARVALGIRAELASVT
tara:strand:+ start:631 stop:771 length:141 start_codon:yes stop_codon:yes gene_type:complete